MVVLIDIVDDSLHGAHGLDEEDIEEHEDVDKVGDEQDPVEGH